ncbi:unnamed protein product, partial [Oncorhynchus mykiss]
SAQRVGSGVELGSQLREWEVGWNWALGCESGKWGGTGVSAQRVGSGWNWGLSSENGKWGGTGVSAQGVGSEVELGSQLREWEVGWNWGLSSESRTGLLRCQPCNSLTDQGCMCNTWSLLFPVPCLGSTRGPRWRDLYTSSDQLRSSEERRDVLAELVYSRSRLKQLNSELQRTVEIADDNNTLLRTENTALRNQVKGMKQSIHDAEQLMDELEEIRSLLVEKDDATGNLEAYIKQLEKEKEILEDQIETIGSEMSRIIPDRATDKKKIVNLSQALQALQLRLEESRLALDHRDEVLRKKDFVVEQLGQSLTEYSSIAQDLKEKMKDLQSQLAEALINGGEGGYMSLDGTLSAATQRSISLAEELGLLPCMMEDSSDEVQREEKIEEEQRVEESVERQADEKKEEVVKEEKQMLEEKSGVWSDMVRGVRAAGGFTLGFLVPLGVLVSMVPGCYDHCTGLGFTNTFWSTARYLIQPYCNVHHIGLPPL